MKTSYVCHDSYVCHVAVCNRVHVCMCVVVLGTQQYEVATIRRLLQIIGQICERALQKRRYSAKEICDFKEPTNRSQNIVVFGNDYILVVTAIVFHQWSGEGLQHLLGATKRAFSAR